MSCGRESVQGRYEFPDSPGVQSSEEHTERFCIGERQVSFACSQEAFLPYLRNRLPEGLQERLAKGKDYIIRVARSLCQAFIF